MYEITAVLFATAAILRMSLDEEDEDEGKQYPIRSDFNRQKV